MKRAGFILVVLAGLWVAMIAVADPESTSTTLEGEYVWNQGPQGDLRAVFTATGENLYDVSFYFEFRGRSHTYSGIAEGSLSDGALKGKVRNEDKRRTFTFRGEFENGQFRGDHAETTSGRARRTGTLTLG